AYGIERAPEKQEDRDRLLTRNDAFIGIIRTIYLKRMESSVAALAASLRSQVDYLALFLGFLDKGKILFPKDRDRLRVMLGGALSDDALESAEADERVRDLLSELHQVDVGMKSLEPLKKAVIADRDTLEGLLKKITRLKAAQPGSDPKVGALQSALE